jgi:ABC-type dipeptide/oligopeptide/nickel transport system permease subunit
MRIGDMVLAFPSLILAMAIAAARGPSIQNSTLALADRVVALTYLASRAPVRLSKRGGVRDHC